MSESSKVKPKKIYIILDNVRSLHNVGSVFRSADAFGVSKIYLCGYTGRPLDKLGRAVKEISKTALGAEKTVPWEYAKHAWRVIESLKKEEVFVVALENNVPGTKTLAEFEPKFPIAVIAGNEVRGLSKEILRRADSVAAIPMIGKKESLNISVACGVALYAITSRS
jgi:23S rRNA (guanosine2251-2'-O)-methyltransferase